MAFTLHGQQQPFSPSFSYECAHPSITMNDQNSYYESHDIENIQHDDTNSQIPGLDGTDDQSLDNPFKRSKRNSRTMSTANQIDRTPIAMRSPMMSNKFDATVHVSETSADSSISRRKRRKIDPVQAGNNVLSGSAASLGGPPSSTVGETKDEASDDDHILHATIHANEEAGNVPEGVDTDETVPCTPRKASGARACESHDSTRPLSGEVCSNNSPSSRTKGSIPRKKAIALHGNGKLLSSPTAVAPPKRSAKPDHDAKNKAAVASRNVKMKNGKFVQSMNIVLHYGKDNQNRQNIGAKITAILSKSNDNAHRQHKISDEGSRTHPFFLGKMKSIPQTQQLAHTAGDTSENDTDTKSRQNEPVAWKDIKFSVRKTLAASRGIESPRPVWPPLSLQHVGREPPAYQYIKAGFGKLKRGKLKSSAVQPTGEEDVLQSFTRTLKNELNTVQEVQIPKRLYLSGVQVEAAIVRQSCTDYHHDAMSSVRNALVTGLSAFDQGQCAGPNMWSMQYAPGRSSEVAQSAVAVLHQWLRSLAVHNVKSGLDVHNSSKIAKASLKKKRRKMKEEFDDFIVHSDDEKQETSHKNSILIVGPSGCGKTASVYAVAKELGFEVFEIHSGMRRSAKDIFDRVGDMAHNHLVHKGSHESRSSSIAPSDAETNTKDDVRSTQSSVAGFLGGKAANKTKALENSSARQTKRDQKQSLILFEEVDQLFEDDKGFWSGVQSLIQNSKRPVVMTCNDLSSVPTEELDLHDILIYTAVDDEFAADLMMYVAAAEGHIINREALSSLYRSKGHDLRASITELNLWCQMTVGSKQGGLDWMLHDGTNKPDRNAQGYPLRVFSEGTYHEGLDLVPQTSLDNEAAIRFAQDSLGIVATEWCDIAQPWMVSSFDKFESSLDALDFWSGIAEAQSTIDIMDESSVPKLASTMVDLCGASRSVPWREACGTMFVQQLTSDRSRQLDLSTSLVPLLEEKPTFPPSQGRLAPSIDLATSKVALDIVPYVRCIVNFDIRLEQQRGEVHGSQGKTRKTRAARAAAEGGDKASTRADRWFPKDLNFQKVLATAGSWPAWFDEECTRSDGFSTASPSVSSPVG